jgi:ABC-type multidrug transport system fused ATPase/permease subunit
VLILNALVKNFEGLEPLPPSTLWIYVALMFVFPMVSSICTAQSNNVFSHIGIQFRNCLINMIYRKSLKLSPSSRQKQSTGMIVNMFSNDTKQLQFFMNFFASSAVAPLQIIVSLALIYLQVGPATFVGFGIMLLVIPFNLYIFTLLNRLRQRKVKKTDLRVKLMNEILSGIRVIKFYAWERAFQKNILAVRQEELVLLTQMAYVVAVGFTLVLQGLPCVQPILVFYTYIRLGNNLTSATAFTTISLFNLMQFPFAFLPLGLAQYSQSLVSMKRMLNFFISEELEPYVTHEDKEDNVVVRMDNLNVGWIKEEEASKPKGVEISGIVAASGPKSQDDNKIVVAVSSTDGQVPTEEIIVESGINRSVYTLRDMTIRIEKGQLVAVVGAVGSGKSSLLTALLGEMHLKSGSVNVVGKIAYCEQRSWILNATVQDNILFGEAMDQDRFDAAIYAASLGDDLRVLPGGVLTEIGKASSHILLHSKHHIVIR